MRALCLIALITLGAVTACGGTEGVPPGYEGGSSGPPVKAYDINPVTRDQVKDGGTLRWGLTEYPTQWNVNHVDGNLNDVRNVIDALMPRAFRSDERGRISLDTDYVQRAEVTSATPKLVVRYVLNPKATWSDGKPITWQDYEAQWKAMNGETPAYRSGSTIGYEEIESVARGTDDHEVLVTFAAPFSEWRSLFSPLYPKSTNASSATFNTNWLNKIPVTAGPFKFAAADPKEKTITVVRDPKWWGARPRLEQIIFRSLDREAQIRAFDNGKLDVFDAGSSGAEYARAKKARDGVVKQAAGRDFRQFTLNGESDILSDPRVRQAVALGIDRKAIAEADLRGLGWPTVLLNNHFFMNSHEGYRENAGQFGAYDVERAGRLLDDAEWKLSGKTRTRNGKDLTLRFVVPKDVPVSQAEAEMARKMLLKLGIKVDIQTVPSTAFFDKFLLPGDYDMAAFSYESTAYPMTSAFDRYFNGVTASGDDTEWYSNIGRSGSTAIDDALGMAGGELDEAKARSDINAADKLVWQDVNVIPLYQRPESVVVRSSLANIGARGFYDLKYTDIGFTR